MYILNGLFVPRMLYINLNGGNLAWSGPTQQYPSEHRLIDLFIKIGSCMRANDYV